MQKEFIVQNVSIFILSKKGITEADVQTAETALFLFVELYAELYSRKYITLNVHRIVHLADCVNLRYTGPLYVNNCFIFEDLNRFIIKHIHGTQVVDTQNHKYNFYAKRLMFNKFLKNSDDLEAIVLYNELTDSVNGRHKFKSEKENGVRHIGPASMSY